MSPVLLKKDLISKSLEVNCCMYVNVKEEGGSTLDDLYLDHSSACWIAREITYKKCLGITSVPKKCLGNTRINKPFLSLAILFSKIWNFKNYFSFFTVPWGLNGSWSK